MMILRKRILKWLNLKNGSFKYFFMLFFLLLIVPIIILGTTLYYKLEHQIDLDMDTQYKKTLSEIEFSVDQKLNDINLYAMQLSNSSWVQEITYMQNQKIDYKRVTAHDISSYTEQLKIHQVLNSFIFCNSVLFVDKDYVVSSRGISTGAKFYDQLFHCDGISYQDLLKSTEQNFNGQILYTKDLKDSSQMRDGIDIGEALVFVCPLNSNFSNRAIMVSYIPINSIKKIVAEHVNTTVYPVSIYEKSGQQLLNTSIQNLSSTNGKTLTLFSESSHFKYQILVPNSVISTSKSSLRASAAIILCLLVCLVAFISYTLTNRQVAPLKKLSGLLGTDTDRHPARANVDYGKLEDLIAILLNKDELLREQNESFKPIVRNALVLKLLNGIPAECEMSVVAQFYSRLFEFSLFTVCLFISDKQIDRERLKKDIDESQEGVLSYCVEVRGMVTAIILNYSESIDTTVLIGDVDYIIEETHSNFGTVLVGNTYNAISKIQNSYLEAIELMEYRRSGTDAQVMYYNDVIRNNNTFYYPINTEMQILVTLHSGDIKSVQGLIREIIDKNNENEGFTLNTARILAYSLIGTALRGLQSENQQDEFYINYHKIDTVSSINELYDYINSVYEEIAKLIIEQNIHEDSLIVEKVDQFMEQNYCLPSMSLSMLSAHIGQPEHYVSRFFKKAYGMNFLEYLHKKRLKKAKDLLVRGEVIREIAVKTGYSNDITFRRTFKKYEGIAPHEYKSMICQGE